MADDIEVERTARLATSFRRAIERCKPDIGYIVYKFFPAGACGDAAEMLARFLRENGSLNWSYVSATRGEQSHAWLERDGVVVDITADQFPDAPSDVIVEIESAWHRRYFAIQSTRAAESAIPLESVAKTIDRTYRMIVADLEYHQRNDKGE
jgi:hypothetical protein